MQAVAKKGNEICTRIYKNHSRRPYFKKIDLLCDRLKQDLSVTNKAVVNVNSHGIAWAIKDFIFVFNRIANAWVIVRDYFYSTSEGMNCVRDAIDPNLEQHFLEWQEATIKFTNCLMQSCENLNARDQRNGNRKNNNYAFFNSPSSANVHEDFQKLFDPVVENSENAQLAGGYLKSAVYKPLSSSEGSTPPDTPNTDRDFEAFKTLLGQLLPDETPNDRNGKTPLYKRGTESSQSSNNFRMNASLVDKFAALDTNEPGIQPLCDNFGADVDVDKLMIAKLFDMQELRIHFGEANTKKIILLLTDVMTLPESISFLSPSEGVEFPNVPNLMMAEKSLSLSQIIFNIQDKKYSSIRDIFVAFQRISEYAKALLTFYKQDEKQKVDIISGFVRGVESALSRYA